MNQSNRLCHTLCQEKDVLEVGTDFNICSCYWLIHAIFLYLHHLWVDRRMHTQASLVSVVWVLFLDFGATVSRPVCNFTAIVWYSLCTVCCTMGLWWLYALYLVPYSHTIKLQSWLIVDALLYVNKAWLMSVYVGRGDSWDVMVSGGRALRKW